MFSLFSTAFPIPRINRLTLLSSRAQPGSPTRAGFARVGVEEPQSPMRPSRAQALARRKISYAGVQATDLLFPFVISAMWAKPIRICTYKMRLMPLESALTQQDYSLYK